MPEKSEKINNSMMIRIMVIFTMILCIIASLVDFINLSKQHNGSRDFSSGWQLEINHNDYGTVDLDEYSFTDISRKSNISLKNKIPTGIPTFAVVSFPLPISAIDVYVNNKLVYSYGSELFNKNKLVGTGLHFIPLPQNSAGKNIWIVIRPSKDNAFSVLENVSIISTDQVYSQFLKANSLRFCVSIFLIVFGLLFIIVGLGLTLYQKKLSSVIHVGITCSAIGTWAMTTAKLMQVLQPNMLENTILEYISLYVAPTAFGFFLLSTWKSNYTWRYKLMRFITYALLIFDIGAIVLQLDNSCHLPYLLTPFHILTLIFGISAVLFVRKPKGEVGDSEHALQIGVKALVFSGALDIIRYIVSKGIFHKNAGFSSSFIPYGVFVMLVMLIISYYLEIYRIISIEFEKNTYEKMAFTDQLTGLGNRTMADKDFMEYENTKMPYSIIAMDLNNLKIVNDTLGHNVGDNLLCAFSEILREAFEPIGKIYRFGGDEFTILINSEFRGKEKEHINKMIELEKEISKEQPFVIDSAYGIADCMEIDNGNCAPIEIYKLADRRMYDMKLASKNQR
ncbi:GGDEF domain-containing protein [Butyrivibrio sp. MC2013]|uniref:GGDEF domain-containing protein n=1 Tax=Butyrivibrio sp. MC2013 TaxID=1280686 RepID=UPI000407AF94|nr:GGDEF domain-containing protein [Butyrivibrio sp. MC2013]